MKKDRNLSPGAKRQNKENLFLKCPRIHNVCPKKHLANFLTYNFYISHKKISYYRLSAHLNKYAQQPNHAHLTRQLELIYYFDIFEIPEKQLSQLQKQISIA